MTQNIYSCTPPEDHWKWKYLSYRDKMTLNTTGFTGIEIDEAIQRLKYFMDNDLELGPKTASQKENMKDTKYKLEVPGYAKEEITVTQKTDNGAYDVFGYWNPPEKYIQVVADNEEFGRRTAEVVPTSAFENVRAEVKNGILYLDWDAPKELAPITVRVD